ncbi:DUF1414 domain-containing protein [Glaciecola siphonariae]|uniref:DUF1414 domain-containing protein n=1 Tax=Glaciecola siphonariae TaxID=521012 RepID=A0ABV9LTK1_9ALTE
MPIQSKYSNEEFEALMQDIFVAIEKNKADRDLAVMALGNTLATIFTSQVKAADREVMVEQFCKVLKKSTTEAKA